MELKFEGEIYTNFYVAKMIFPRTSQAQHAMMRAPEAYDEADVLCT